MPVAAIRFFLLTLLSGVLFYFLSKSSARNLWQVPPILSVYGIILVSFFLLTQDWGQMVADVDLINVIGSWWMAIRPEIPFNPPHQNMVAGTLSIILSLDVVWLVRERNRNNRLRLIVVLMTIGFLALGLWLTSSRGAWFSLLVGLVIGGGAGLLAHFPRIRQLNKNIVLVIVVLTIVAVGIFTFAGVNYLSGDQAAASSVNNLDSRVSLYRNALELAKEQWLLGGGLGTFPGLYSSYILILPVNIFFYSHNLYLDVWIEQGIFGLIAWLIILAGSLLLCARHLLHKAVPEQDGRLLSAGILASLVTLSLHGLIDNPLYAVWGRSVLFLLPGMALAGGIESNRNIVGKNIQAQRIVAVVTILAVIITIGVFNRAIRSAWYANLGAIVMAKSQLSDWPTGKWPDKSMAEQLASAKPLFEKSLNLQTSNCTSNYRLGLIEFYGQDFSSAEQHLSKAYQLNGHHRGIQKALGYTYVWLGEFDQASSLLKSIPEAREELGVYAWWWKTQDRSDLAENSDKMLAQID
jgi:tetratricopeptide (TPR) repeat protein